ncbi:MAG TPA: polyprenyl diphosphate synthase [Candidatus Saccharimonadales bacterium]
MAENQRIVPQHIGFIVDGNRRWARKHGLPTYEGHLAGYNAVQEVAKAAFNAGVSYVSAYIFSTENWKRSEQEVTKIMGMALKLVTSDLHLFDENNIRLRILGSRQGLNERILKAFEAAEARTEHNTRGTLAICFNYGGQLEIADACKKIVESGIEASEITPELIADNLYAPDIPQLDLVVRTSGEQRLSNFMLWRAAYSEFIFLEKLWPEMTKEDVDATIEEYSRRSRRFGG